MSLALQNAKIRKANFVLNNKCIISRNKKFRKKTQTTFIVYVMLQYKVQ